MPDLLNFESRFIAGALVVRFRGCDVRLVLRPLAGDAWHLLATDGPKLLFNGRVDESARPLLLTFLLNSTPGAHSPEGLRRATLLVERLDTRLTAYAAAA